MQTSLPKFVICRSILNSIITGQYGSSQNRRVVTNECTLPILLRSLPPWKTSEYENSLAFLYLGYITFIYTRLNQKLKKCIHHNQPLLHLTTLCKNVFIIIITIRISKPKYNPFKEIKRLMVFQICLVLFSEPVISHFSAALKPVGFPILPCHGTICVQLNTPPLISKAL